MKYLVFVLALIASIGLAIVAGCLEDKPCYKNTITQEWHPKDCKGTAP